MLFKLSTVQRLPFCLSQQIIMILPDKFLLNNWDKYLGVVCLFLTLGELFFSERNVGNALQSIEFLSPSIR